MLTTDEQAMEPIKLGYDEAGTRFTLKSTKQLLNAALKVWELKNGYRPERVALDEELT